MRPIVSISSNMCNRWCLKAKIVLIPNSGYNPPVGGRDLIGCGMPAADVRWLRSVTATTTLRCAALLSSSSLSSSSSLLCWLAWGSPPSLVLAVTAVVVVAVCVFVFVCLCGGVAS